ncbi:MAG: hypothetical protein J7L53_05050 [Deltaproteobacteria bacterium]|nr:hypothetical protein [Deltaproteobacteria bacterium]
MRTDKIAAQHLYMKGVALDLPFLRLRYIKIQGNPPNKSLYTQKTSSFIPNIKNRKLPANLSINNVIPPEIPTLGPDPIISKASVIHELAYGRIRVGARLSREGTSYPTQDICRYPTLDIIV